MWADVGRGTLRAVTLPSFAHFNGSIWARSRAFKIGNGMAAWVKILHPDAWFETRNDAFVCFFWSKYPDVWEPKDYEYNTLGFTYSFGVLRDRY
jgi:hypothetical protein